MMLRVRSGGMQTTVQDLGRPRVQHAAVPAGGAMDRLACRVANILAGNDEHAALLEITLVGPVIDFATDALIALTGGDLQAYVDDVPLRPWHAALVPAGSTLRFGQAVRGCRAYLALCGGVDVPLVFESRSTYLRGAFGGYAGRALRVGDSIPCAPATERGRSIIESFAGVVRGAARRVSPASWSAGATVRPPYASDTVVRVLEGAHTLLLDDASRERIYGTRFRVSSASDRMGYRLEGETLALREPIELLSEGVAFGTIQLPPGGAPIVLMADRQTAGGYPRVGEVISVDLPLVAQLKPGDTVRFRRVSLPDAQRLYLEQELELAQLRAGIALRFPITKH
jgi:antagonist of KipI